MGWYEVLIIWDGFFTGSIRKEDAETRILFLAMLKLANSKGVVRGTDDFLANYAAITVPECQRGLERLASPDPHSTNPAENGRRIKSIGKNLWQIINYEDYIERYREANRQAYMRRYMRDYQPKKRKQQSSPSSTSLTKSDFTAEEWAVLVEIRKAIAKVHEKPLRAPSQRELKDFRRILRYGLSDAREAIMWALADNEPRGESGFCWAAQVLTIPTLKKFENIRSQWRAVKPKIEASKEDKQAIEAARRRVEREQKLKARDGSVSSLGEIVGGRQ